MTINPSSTISGGSTPRGSWARNFALRKARTVETAVPNELIEGHIMLKYKLYVLVVKADGNLAILAALAMVLTAIWRGVLPIGSFY
ncbi:UNVERIFIED_ORG: hypothetical protein GGD51_005062 [Rhizobium esperanzae]